MRWSTSSRGTFAWATATGRSRADGWLTDGQMAILAEGDAVRFRGVAGGGRLLLLAGVPLGEPVARYGPFVMNNEAEIDQAVQDYQSGRMGEITRTAEVAAQII